MLVYGVWLVSMDSVAMSCVSIYVLVLSGYLQVGLSVVGECDQCFTDVVSSLVTTMLFQQ